MQTISYEATCDTEAANATYIYIRQGDKVAKTVKVSDHCNVDLNEEGWPIGVEII